MLEGGKKKKEKDGHKYGPLDGLIAAQAMDDLSRHDDGGGGTTIIEEDGGGGSRGAPAYNQGVQMYAGRGDGARYGYVN